MIEIPARQGKALRLRRGQRARVVNTRGQQVVDTWAFNDADLKEFMSMEHSRVAIGHIIPAVGDTLVTNRRRPILTLIEEHAGVEPAEMFAVYNMGTGFCVILAKDDADAALTILARHKRDARVIGYAVADRTKSVYLPQQRLIGTGKRFRPE